MDVVDQLLVLFRESGETYRSLAKKLGWTNPTLHRRLAGKQGMSREELDALAAALGRKVVTKIVAVR